MKDINDYLYLYFGCEAEVLGKSNGRLVGLNQDIAICWHPDYGAGSTLAINIKLLLRPLSDMTEEEKKEISFDAYKVMRKEQNPTANGTERAVTWAAKQTAYLLKQGFDLFNLIPEGLAIDKTKLKT